ncbi:hypothetical protein KO505_08870 [Psychrosphaera sp. F3M07]|uniref:hypothetical protein n=1 Tax=Psychrosphaera sp. F3M07 TaxID=2841560 RepID=UPI001C09E2A0|nr:hypothetical protein [Psychrosphaera sp. F3M07]MBU2918072.1 hypothetical protein [Psychrosphaera sp. F3M07]
MESGIINFFEIPHCGLYRLRKQAESEHIAESLSSVLNHVRVWAEKQEFKGTLPWSEDDHPFRTKVYYKSSSYNQTTGDYLFTFWKQYPDDSGRMTGVVEDAKVGDDEDDSFLIKEPKHNGQNLLMGVPLYYWFIPELNIVASITFPHSNADTENVGQYIKRCFEMKVPHPNKKEVDSSFYNHKRGQQINKTTVTYLSDDGKFSMGFRFLVKSKALNIKAINSDVLAPKISHIVVKEKVSVETQSNKGSVLAFFERIQGIQQTKFEKEVEVISEASISKEELEQLINIHSEEFDPETGENNIGYKLYNDKKTCWFDSFSNRPHIKLDPVLKIGGTRYKSSDILDTIDTQRDELLASVKRSIAQKNSELKLVSPDA